MMEARNAKSPNPTMAPKTHPAIASVTLSRKSGKTIQSWGASSTGLAFSRISVASISSFSDFALARFCITNYSMPWYNAVQITHIYFAGIVMDDRMQALAAGAARQLLQSFRETYPQWTGDRTPLDE